MTIIQTHDLVLITGANGFIGSRVVDALLRAGFTNLRCFVRPSGNLSKLLAVKSNFPQANVEIMPGNLLSPPDCDKAASNAAVIFHLAAGIEKTFPGSFMNSVVTTRNLLDSAVATGCLKRFVNISSFAVYSNRGIRRGGMLDENCPLETEVVQRSEAYVFAKLKQDELVMEYGKKHGVNFVILRPGAVYGPGTKHLTARVGIDTFGFFMHIGGSNRLPLTYVDNCADAIVLAGVTPGVDGEIFNVVDDDLPTSRKMLRLYKKNAKRFRSLYVPYRAFFLFCWFWEKYSHWSKGQFPPAFNRLRCAAYWKGNTYSNRKLKQLLGWKPAIGFKDASQKYFEAVRESVNHA